MTAETESLLQATLEGKEGELREAGRAFFSARLDDRQTCDYIYALLKAEAYEKLAEIFSQGFISKQYGDRDYISKSADLTLDQRYFDLFVETCERCGVEARDLFPMFVAAFSSKGALANWRDAIRVYFVKYAFADYDRAVEVFARYDTRFDLYPILFQVDPGRAEETVLSLLLNGKHVNKTTIRRYLLENKIDIVPKLISLYEGADAKRKEALTRLLLIYKNDGRAARFLHELDETESSRTVRKLLDRDRAKVSLSSQEDGWCARFFSMMLTGERMPYGSFLRAIKTAEGGRAASSLFFTHYHSRGAAIVIVDGGKVLDLENHPLELGEGEVGVLHPADLGPKYEYLKRLNIQQCFEQIRREIYVPSAEEKAYRCCKRLNGTVIAQGALKAGLKNWGFRLMSKTREGAYSQMGLLREDVLCVTEFTPTDFKRPQQSVSIGDIRFYRYADVIKLAGSLYVEGVSPYEIDAMPPRLFSEFLYSVYSLLRCR